MHSHAFILTLPPSSKSDRAADAAISNITLRHVYVILLATGRGTRQNQFLVTQLTNAWQTVFISLYKVVNERLIIAILKYAIHCRFAIIPIYVIVVCVPPRASFSSVHRRTRRILPVIFHI